MGSVRSSEVVGGLDVPASSLPRVSAPSSLLAEERVGGILVPRAVLREGSTAGFLSVVRLLVAVADRGVGSGPVVAGRVGGSRVLGVVSRSVDEDAVAELGAAEGPVLAGEFDLEGLAGATSSGLLSVSATLCRRVRRPRWGGCGLFPGFPVRWRPSRQPG
jgi:hypothetical protein